MAHLHTTIHEIAFSLPLPPSSNSLYASTSKETEEGKHYTRRVASKRLRQYKHDAPLLMHQQGLIRDMWKGATVVRYDVLIYLKWMPTATRRADVSNRLKAYEDVVSHYLGFDDALIEEGHFKRGIDARCPRIDGHWYIHCS